VVCCLVSLALVALAVPAQSQDLRTPIFNYDDIDRFAKALAEMQAGADAEQAFQLYLDGAGPGLFGWTQRYGNVTAERYARAYAKYPAYFEYLAGLRPALQGLETEIADDLRALRDLVGEAMGRRTLSILPTYYFVSPMGGGGSIEPIANMIAVDYYGRNADAPLEEFEEIGFFPKGKLSLQPLVSLAFVVPHEMVHWYQVIVQGEVDYVALYRQPGADTLLARAVREGGADFLAHLASGRTTPDQQAYGSTHEKELWGVFRERLHEPTNDHPGWFSGRNADFPEAPWQIGYWLGMRMCQAYFDAAPDKSEAIRTILGAQTAGTYKAIAAAYDARLRDATAPQDQGR
jgi:hypothetical protein